MLSTTLFLTVLAILGTCFADDDGDCPNIISRSGWGGVRARSVSYLILPLPYVVIHHTVTPECHTTTSCSERVRNIQSYHMNDLHWDDLGFSWRCIVPCTTFTPLSAAQIIRRKSMDQVNAVYTMRDYLLCEQLSDGFEISGELQRIGMLSLLTFFIGGDGNVYEGVGWNKEGAHTYAWNKKSAGIVFIGNFQNVEPSQQMLDAARKLVNCGKSEGSLRNDVKIFGGRQLVSTLSPGDKLYSKIQSWPEWGTP